MANLWLVLCKPLSIQLKELRNRAMIQRKYRIVKTGGWTALVREINDLLEQEYKDTEGYLFTAAGRWQCLGAPFKDGDDHCQAMVFERDED